MIGWRRAFALPDAVVQPLLVRVYQLPTPLYHCGRIYAGQGLIIKALHASSRTLGRVERVFTGHGHSTH